MNINETINFDHIADFAAKERAISKSKLSPGTRVGEGLQIVGDDAEEFLQSFAEKFNVNFSAFEFHQYFPGEATAEMHHYLLNTKKTSFNPIFRLINQAERSFWRIFSKDTSFKTITLQDLENAAKLGKWLNN